MITSDIKKAIDHDIEQSVESIIDHYSKIGILCIDDIGAEKVTEYQTSVLYQILNRRIENGTSTIVTTNFDGSDLISNYGPRIQSRLGSGDVIVIKSKKDLRVENSNIWSCEV